MKIFLVDDDGGGLITCQFTRRRRRRRRYLKRRPIGRDPVTPIAPILTRLVLHEVCVSAGVLHA